MQSSILLLKQQMLSLNEEKKMCQLKKLLVWLVLALGLLKICLDYEIFMSMELIQKQNLVRVHF